jgi:hypothetical protein
VAAQLVQVRRAAGCDVGDQFVCLGVSDRLEHAWVTAQHGLDLADLDPLAPDLHLPV